MSATKGYTVFFDFDNTITTCDVIDDMLLRFSKDKQWIKLEQMWEKGRIGSKTCLEGQIKGIHITRDALNKYLSQIKIDPCFKKTIDLLNSRDVKIVILSDNFGYILRRILRNNNIRNLKIYANRLTGAGLKTYFPFKDKKCRKCAHCKRNSLLANVKKGSLSVYIGDGLSDVCPAQYADIVFAKGSLLNNFRSKKLRCIPYSNMKDVYGYFKRSLEWKKDRN